MIQPKFIMMINRSNPQGGIVDSGNGTVVAMIREGVHITHNYKKNNSMEIIFTEDQARYKILSENELESILRIHLGNINFIQLARKYCDEHLTKI